MAHSVPARSITADPLKVFVSYSRADSSFADELSAGLEAFGGFDVMIDREDIHEGENWKARLGALIESADSVVFILTPRSSSSPVCLWEVEQAVRCSKRIVPVLAAPLENVGPPPQLAALNYVRFDPLEDGRSRSFVQGIVALRRTLNTDIEWIREHTRLMSRASEWISAGRPENRLLSGSDVLQARQWLDHPPKEAPPPTELHLDFLRASEQAEADRVSDERARAERFRKANLRLKWAIGAMALFAGGMAFAVHFAILKSTEATKLASQLAIAQLQQSQGLPVSAPPQGSVQLPTITARGGRFLNAGAIQTIKDGRAVQVIKEVSFQDAAGRIWIAPVGTISDGASLPPSLQTTLGSPLSSEFVKASVLYDHYVTTRERSWEDTQDMYFQALLASGVSSVKAQIIYAAIRFGGPRWKIN